MSLQKNTIANYLGQFWVVVVNLVFVPVYVGALGVEAYGIIGFYVVLQTWFSILDLGMTPTVTRETSRYTVGTISPESIWNLIRSIEVILFSLTSFIAIALWLASTPIASYWLNPDSIPKETLSTVLKIISVVVATRFCEGIYRGVLYGLEKQVLYNVSYAILATIRYVGAAILVTVVPSLVAFFFWQLVMSFITLIILARTAYSVLPKLILKKRFSIAAIRDVGKFAGGMTLTAAFALLFTQIDKVFLTRLVDLESFGFYMLALAAAGIFPMLAGPTAAAFFPRFTAAVAAGDMTAERDLFRVGTQVVSILSVPAVTLCIILGNKIIFGWTGDATLAENVGPILSLVAVGTFCNGVLQIPFMLQLAHGWTTLSVRTNLLGIMILIPMMYIGIKNYGLVGAAAAWALANLVVFFIATIVLHSRILKEELTRFFLQILAVPLASCVLVVWLVSLLLHDAEYKQLESLAIVAATGVLALLIVMIALPLGRRQLRLIFNRLDRSFAR